MKTNDTHESVSQIAGRGFVRVSLLAVVLALTASSFAQSKAAAAAKAADAKAQATANTAAAPSTKAPRGAGERIQVHGQWTIEVRNRDGSVDRHVELENALVNDGPALLTALLTGTSVAGSWALAVSGDPEAVRIRVRLLDCDARQLCDGLWGGEVRWAAQTPLVLSTLSLIAIRP